MLCRRHLLSEASIQWSADGFCWAKPLYDALQTVSAERSVYTMLCRRLLLSEASIRCSAVCFCWAKRLCDANDDEERGDVLSSVTDVTGLDELTLDMQLSRRNIFVPAVHLSAFILLFLPSSPVSWFYFNRTVPIRKCSGEHSCMSSTFSIAIHTETSTELVFSMELVFSKQTTLRPEATWDNLDRIRRITCTQRCS